MILNIGILKKVGRYPADNKPISRMTFY